MSNTETMLERANRTTFSRASSVRASSYALKYHITAPSGWINDPNGLVHFGDRYHVFYQHYPYEPKWGPMHWGHVTSPDLAHWQHEPVALAPDQPYEKGCFSGSGVDDNGTLTVIYTAHDDDNPIMETQCVARSFDGGQTFVKSPLNPVIPVFPPECSKDFRDPKVWKHDGRWYLVAGTSHNGRGCAVLYEGDDLEHWTYRGIIAESDGSMGFMWECPSFFHADGWDVLLFSPMGMPGHKNIALLGKFDYETGKMTVDHWQDLDIGENFYAAQVLDDSDRTLLFAWMAMWDKPDPSREDGWCGALTIPRELHVKDGKLLALPAPDLKVLRGEQLIEDGCPRCIAKLAGNCIEISIELGDGAFAMSDENGELVRVVISDNKVSFTTSDGYTASALLDLPREKNLLHIFVDQSSVECFVNDGEVTFSERIFPKGALTYHAEGNITANAWALEDAFEVPEC